MHVQKIAMGFLLTGCLAFMASCASPEEVTSEEENSKVSKEEVIYFSGELTGEERESGHLTLELMEKVSVDADFTKHSEYQEGLNAYYVSSRQDGKVKDKKQFQKNPKIGGVPLTKFLEQIEEKSAGKFQTDKQKAKYQAGENKTTTLQVQVPYQDEKNNLEKQLSLELELSKNNIPVGFELTFERETEFKEKAHGSVHQISEDTIGGIMLGSFLDWDMADLSFGNSEEIAGKLKQVLEDMVGYKLCDWYQCMPVSRSNYQMALATAYAQGDVQIVPIEGEYYTYYFYQEVDGFPWDDIAALTRMETDEDGNMEYIVPSNEKRQSVTYGEDGIRELQISDRYITGEAFQKVVPCDIDTVLQGIKDYFESQKILLTTMIDDISLRYTGDFTEDGEEIVRPLWRVSYSQGYIWMDAETGKCVEEDI